jgi:hypothetical protein
MRKSFSQRKKAEKLSIQKPQKSMKKLESAALAYRVACLFGLTCVARAGQPSEGRQPAEGSPQGDAKHRQHPCGYCRRPHALAKPKIQQQRGTL